MAKTKASYETERRIALTPTSDGSSTGKAVLQSNIALSRMNNRLYRQCRDYTVSLEVNPLQVSGNSLTYSVYTLANTWFVKGAIKHAYDTYMQMMADEMAQGIKKARWHDFSINEQNPDGVFEYLNASLYDGDGWATLSADESITDSSVTDSGGTSQGFHLIGNLANSYNVFREFAKKLNYQTPDDESVSSDQPYDGLLDLDDADVLAERGDRAPYDRDFTSFLPDDTTVDDTQGQNMLTLAATMSFNRAGSAGKAQTAFFNAPLGLVWIEKEDNGSAADLGTAELIAKFKPGFYKGVESRSLTE